MDDLAYPVVPTYFIAWEGPNVVHGVVNPNQTINSGLANFETFINKTLYIQRLSELGAAIETDQEA